MNQTNIDNELRRRSDYYLAQTHLRVDYYRIRRSLAYPLPVTSFHLAEMPLRGMRSRDYPWSIWLSWALEERINALGYAAIFCGMAAAQAVARRDIDALTAWPTFRQLPKPDLSLGHCLRALWRAWSAWPWVDDALRQRIAEACTRGVDDMLPLSDALHGPLTSSDDVLAQRNPYELLHNIPIIGTIGAALAARVANHPALTTLDRRVGILVGALLDARTRGFSEAVAYDGYLLDFVADWLTAVPASASAPFLDHSRMGDYLAQSCQLAASGDATAVAEIGDVEPVHMPFHISAQAKLQTLRWDDALAWYLEQCRLQVLRSDALAAMRGLSVTRGNGHAPPAGAHDVHYAAVLRSGYASGDLAVAMAASSSSMGHIHCDNGSVVIGTRGRWMICDPGYQQYLDTSERRFTVGPQAHNAPIINGAAQTSKQVQRPQREDLGDGLLRMRLELRECYPATAGVRSLVRTVWLAGNSMVAVCDRIELARWESLSYHWHGHPSAAWWMENDEAQLHWEDLPGLPLHVRSPQVRLTETMLDRLPGSRGQLTLSVPVPPVTFPASGLAHIWWFFMIGVPVPIHVDGASARVGRLVLVP